MGRPNLRLARGADGRIYLKNAEARRGEAATKRGWPINRRGLSAAVGRNQKECPRNPRKNSTERVGPRITRISRIKASAAKSIREIREIRGPFSLPKNLRTVRTFSALALHAFSKATLGKGGFAADSTSWSSFVKTNMLVLVFQQLGRGRRAARSPTPKGR